MIFRRPIRTEALFFFGALTLAVWSTLQHFIDRSGHGTNTTDFLLGFLFGVSVGLLMLTAWRIGRRRHGEPDGCK
ncbi:MAG: hypothetical protein WBX15_19465 [Thermoanaerobaculia bacterium]